MSNLKELLSTDFIEIKKILIELLDKDCYTKEDFVRYSDVFCRVANKIS